jgi:hypothetical protein
LQISGLGDEANKTLAEKTSINMIVLADIYAYFRCFFSASWRHSTDSRSTIMLQLRPFESLGHANHGWLDAHHHFSFAEYYDPARMHWGNLRVWNDDLIAAGSGFRTRTATWKSSPMCVKARSATRTAWATRAVPKPVTCR